MQKEKYEDLEIETIEFDTGDVITASNDLDEYEESL